MQFKIKRTKKGYKVMYKPNHLKRFKTWISTKSKKRALKYKEDNFKLLRVAIGAEKQAFNKLNK